MNNYLPLYETRLINEDHCVNKFFIELFEEIEIINDINYGFNEFIRPEEGFPHFMINHIRFKGKEGIFSCFLSNVNNEHFIKPIIYLKSNSIEVISFSIMTNNQALIFFKKYIELRTPFVKVNENLMNIFDNELTSIDDLFDDEEE